MSPWLGVGCFIGVIALIIGFSRDPNAPFSMSLKWFVVLFAAIGLYLLSAIGNQR